MHYFAQWKSLAGIISYISHLSYAELWLLVVASGHIVPIPEGVTFLVLGFLASAGKGSLIGFLLIAILGALSFDLILYTLARLGARMVSKLSHQAEAKYFEKYKEASRVRLFSMVVASHFVPGWRSLNPVICALVEMPVREFVLFSLTGCVFYASAYVLSGVIFHSQILGLITALLSLHRAGLYITLGVASILVLGYLFFEKKK